jgi:hypothetical protein
LGGRGGTDGLYFAIRNYYCLVFLRRCSRSINDSDVVENENLYINADEVRDITRPLGLRNRNRGNKQ